MASKEEVLELTRERLITAAAAEVHRVCGELISDTANYEFRSLISAQAHAIVVRLTESSGAAEELLVQNDLVA